MATITTVGRKDMYIGGRYVPSSSGEYREIRNPADATVLGEAPEAAVADVDAAVADAADGLRVWTRMDPAERARVLARIAVVLRERKEEFAQLETLDNGKPITLARGDVEGSARYFEFFAGIADKINGLTIPLGSDYLSYTINEPYGVVAQILPWNAPLQQAARGLAPCLAAGNVAVVKPAEDTPFSTLALAELAVDCGLPPGVMNVVTGVGEVVGACLAEHPAVRKVAFTGSVPTGRAVMHVAAERLIPATLELGGKSANIVFADADLEAAVQGSATAINRNSGQNCSAGSRLLVHESVHDEFVERLTTINRSLTIGPGIDDPDMGPITTADQFERVKAYLKLGEQEGATRISGGVELPSRSSDGYFVEPTVFVGVDNHMRIAREEIFGPVVGILKFADDDEAVAIANDSDYGLVAGIWTQSLSRAHRVASALEVGQVFVNEYYAGGVETPFGGTKQSGFGREKGVEAVLQYAQTKAVNVRL